MPHRSLLIADWPLRVMVDRIGQTQPPLSAGAALGIGLAALVVVAFPVTWTFVRYFNAMAHEGSHAIMFSLLGWRVDGVWLKAKNGDGATTGVGPGKAVSAAFIGYVGPSLFGLAAAKLISIGHSVAVLWLTLALLVLLLAQVRNLFGIAAILMAGYLIYTFARYGSVAHETMAAYGIAWLLLLSGVLVVARHWDGAKDASILEKQTQIVPATFAKIWLVGALFCLFLSTKLMM